MMKKILTLVFAAAALALVLGFATLPGSAPVQAKATTVTTNETVPLDMVVFVPCADGGAGELVQLGGVLHILTHITDDGRGGFLFSQSAHPQGATGTGLTTGDQYHATGITRSSFHIIDPFPWENTFVNNFRIIGEGPGNNLLVHETFHVTVNANGEVTSDVSIESIDCK